MIRERLFDWWSVIILLGIVQGVIMVLTLLLSMRNKRPLILMAVLIIILLWHHLQSLSIYLGFYTEFPHFYGADQGSLFLVGPLFWMFIRFQTVDYNSKFSPREWLHFLPFALTLIIQPVIFLDSEAKVETINAWLTATRYDNPALKQRFILDDFIFLLESLHMIVYFVFAAFTLRKYSRIEMNFYASAHQLNFRWLTYITWLTLGVILISFILQKILYKILNYYYYSLDYIYILPMSIFIYFIGFYALRKSELFSISLQPAKAPVKYAKSSLSEDVAEIYASRLAESFRHDKYFLDPELKLSSLAEKLDMQPNHLSQVINEKFEMTFFDFVNKHRIEEATRILQNPDSTNDKLSAIAFECGFNNRVSFHNYFKKFTEMTPSEYRQKQMDRKEN